MIGETIDGRYRVIRILGQGGMGAVYEAEHTGTGRHVAVKVIINADLAKHESIVKRFEIEAKAAGSVDTEHIVQVLDSGADTRLGVPYMVMEFLKGEDLQELIKRCGCLHPDLALRLVGQACIGLLKAHETGVVHRDIKPANLFLARRENGEIIVKIVDFGIAKVKLDIQGPDDTGLTRTGNLLGSPRYMSPEQAMGKKTIDHRTDVWSMGVVLYEALTGRVPHAHCESLGAMIMAICSTQAPNIQDLAPWVPPEVAELVHGALVIDADQRFQSMNVLINVIRQIVGSDTFTVHGDNLAPLPEAQKAFKAPRTFAGTTRLPLAVSGSESGAEGAANTGLNTGINTGVGSIPGVQAATQSKSNRGTLLAVGAMLAFGVSSAVGYKILGGRTGAAEAAPAPSSSPVAETPTVQVPVPVPVPVPPAEQTVKLAVVAPAGATVEIDEKEATLQDGSVEIRGLLGSTHKVRIRLGKTETIGEVVIADSGVVPSKVQLGVAIAKAKAPGGAASGAAGSTKPAVKPPESGVARQFD